MILMIGNYEMKALEVIESINDRVWKNCNQRAINPQQNVALNMNGSGIYHTSQKSLHYPL